MGIGPDGLNAIIHAARGNKEGTLTSLGAMIPVVGQGVTAGKYGIKGIKYASKYKNYNVNKLLKSFKLEKPYHTKKFNYKLGSTKMNLKETIASVRNSVKPGTYKKPEPGVRTGILPNGNRITIRTKGGHGPTIEIVTKNRGKGVKGEITKMRING